MTLAEEQLAAWNEPDGVSPRGTLVVIPGRGEGPSVYERFGRRLAADTGALFAAGLVAAGGRAGRHHGRPARRAQRSDPPHGGRDDRAVPGAAAARARPAGHRGLRAARIGITPTALERA